MRLSQQWWPQEIVTEDEQVRLSVLIAIFPPLLPTLQLMEERVQLSRELELAQQQL